MTLRARHDHIIRSLRRTGWATVAELARDSGVSRRTILRDIGSLRDQGFVIHAEAGRGGGLQLDPQSVQTTPRLSVPEVFALLISVAAMRAAGSLPFSTLADAGLAKIERALPADKLRDLRRILQCLHIGQISPLQDISDIGAIDPDLLHAFEAAFLQQNLLRFRYCDGKGKNTQRLAEPQAMLVLPPLWYLVGWDNDKAAFRHFRMDRITMPQVVTDMTFRRRHVPFADDVCPYSAAMG